MHIYIYTHTYKLLPSFIYISLYHHLKLQSKITAEIWYLNLSVPVVEMLCRGMCIYWNGGERDKTLEFLLSTTETKKCRFL